MKKSGANFEDRNAIKRWEEEGKTAAEISDYLQIEVGVVKNFMKPAPKPVRKKEVVDDGGE